MTEKFTNEELIKKFENSKYKRIHLSHKKIKKFKNSKQNKECCIFKPNGFWYALDNEWLNMSYDMNNSSLCCYIYSIKLKSIHFTKKINNKNINKILLIENMKHLDKFINKYSIVFGEEMLIILWNEVAKNFRGIEFNPYLKITLMNKYEFSELIYRYSWYCYLDFPSGCIWNFDNLDINCKLIANKPNKKARKWNYL